MAAHRTDRCSRSPSPGAKVPHFPIGTDVDVTPCPAAGFFELAQTQREAELLVVRQRLIAKHKHGIFGHSGMNGRARLGR